MVIVKRLYRFMLRSFLPLFLMTFFICLFIVLMQFLWRFIDDLVGKGLEIRVIAELFFYAALSFVPMALPLAILLASLMTFGNLGERFELTAMKASGISLLKAMRPLIILICFVSVGAFFFQNDVLPIAQTKMYTLLYSARQKSPELEIPEGVFYDQIPGYNFYVEKKNPETGTLYDMMIYDVSKGFDNARVILADSGHLKMADDRKHLFLQLYNGEQFENLRENSAGGNSRNQPYRRESFDLKEILLAFDANFNRMDESGMKNQYIGKNIQELQHTIDSVSERIDSVGNVYAKELQDEAYVRVPRTKRVMRNGEFVTEELKPVAMDKPIDIDSLFYKSSPNLTRTYINHAIQHSKRVQQDFTFKSYTMSDDRRIVRRHAIELTQKFTLSLACLIFFFIGAPLGAIIRKGGLGAPLVISVFLFIVYYIIDNTGKKMARDGGLEVWQGMWLSSAILLPLGVFLTYKAMKDSAVFDMDAYKNFIRRLRGKQKRELEVKEFTMNEVDPAVAVALLQKLDAVCLALKERYSKMSFSNKILYLFRRAPLRNEAELILSDTIDYLSNSRDKNVINRVNLYPFQLTVRNVAETMRVNSALEDLFKKQIETQAPSSAEAVDEGPAPNNPTDDGQNQA